MRAAPCKLLLIGLALLGGGMALAQNDPFAFMPDGGRESFSIVFPTPDLRAWAFSQQLAAGGWAAEIIGRSPDLAPRTVETLAAYLCQSCHSLFSGYLMHRRDKAGWLATFSSPFHTGITMSDAEKTIFADYSAINMPMRFEDVPPELRF